jgi:LuxR family maltose regulon positive regulatory protein
MASFLGDVPAIIQYASQALDYLPEQDLSWRSTAAIALGDAQGFKGDMVAAYPARLEAAEASRSAGNTVFSILAYLKVAITTREQGLLQRTIAICRQQVEFAQRSGLSQGSMAGGLLAIWGEVMAELGDLDGAMGLTDRGVELAERSGETAVLGWSYLCFIRVLFSAGDMAGAQALIQKVEDTARASKLPPWIANEMAAWQVRLWLAEGKLDAASQWLRERGLIAAGELQPPQAFDFFSLNEHVMLSRFLIAQEQLDAATGLLPRLLEAAEAGGRTSISIEILALQAMALQAGGETDLALSALERALILAEPEGFVQIFVDEGPPMARLLEQPQRKAVAADYIARILAAFELARLDTGDGADPGIRRTATVPEKPDRELSASHGAHGAPVSASGSSALVEPLSGRELEVLQLIAEGLTNRAIASRLFLSLNTVKAHTRNIYGKLGVNSRMQAVARARALGILPST